LKTTKLDLPRKYEFKEGETNPLYKRFNGWNKISYSQFTSFKEYKMGYLRDYILGVGTRDSGMFALFGSNCGDYLNPYDDGEYQLLSDSDTIILDTLKNDHPTNAEFEYEILIDLEPFGLEKTVLQGFTDRQHFTAEKKLETTDYKTLTIKTKKVFYESDEYQQLSTYGYGLEELGFEIGEMYVTGLGRSGNNTIKGDKNVLRLSGEVVKIPKPYNREKAKKVIESIAKVCLNISKYFSVYNKYFKNK